jgi:hypothetical protein
MCRLLKRLKDDTKKEILFHALNIIYRGKARPKPNSRRCMLRIVSAFTWLLGCALLFPLHADDSELQLLNVNVGGGLSVPLNPTIRYVGVDGNAGSGMGVPGWKFFIESRYNYAWSNFIPITFVPVTVGFRFN